MHNPLRREFLQQLATAAGALVLAPTILNCAGKTPADAGAAPMATDDSVPRMRPDNWDPIAFNLKRGLAGAIPQSYWPSIQGADGVAKHLGKHLPYVPAAAGIVIPAGYLPVMWGDPQKGYAKHPNAAKSDTNPEGHWYNWIRVAKAGSDEHPEVESRFSNWPATAAGDNGSYAALGSGAVADEEGKNTIYLIALPKDLKPGDTVRIWAHCLTHGEYVDFLTV